jgi:putative ABC transport system substrate-binding protein
VKLGLVASLNRPGGNATGVSILSSMLVAKQLELLRELVPTAMTISFLVNPDNPNTEERTREMQEAVRAVGRRLHLVTASAEADLEPAFATIQRRAGALIVPADPFFASQRDRLVALAARHALPASYPFSFGHSQRRKPAPLQRFTKVAETLLPCNVWRSVGASDRVILSAIDVRRPFGVERS